MTLHCRHIAGTNLRWAGHARLGTRDVHPSSGQALATYDLPEVSCCQLHTAPLLCLILGDTCTSVIWMPLCPQGHIYDNDLAAPGLCRLKLVECKYRHDLQIEECMSAM